MTCKILIDDENKTMLADNLTLNQAERELSRACNDGLDAYIAEEN